METDWVLVGKPQARVVCEVASEARADLTVVSPFVSAAAMAEMLTSLRSDRHVTVQMVTSADPEAIVQGACDLSALQMIVDRGERGRLFRLHGLHAKVYVADRSVALITSANLTTGGLRRNYEYGVLVRDSVTVGRIRDDVLAYLTIATPLTSSTIADIRTRLPSVPIAATPVLRRAAAQVGEILLREHVTGRTEHEVFASAILFVLRREGPLSTSAMQPQIQALHPELCDDSRELIIDGRRFGKRWKHQVRNAQQYLKQRGLIELVNGVWRVTG